jgi:hypothetical protein
MVATLPFCAESSADWTIFSDSESRAEVASSRSRIGGFRTSALQHTTNRFTSYLTLCHFCGAHRMPQSCPPPLTFWPCNHLLVFPFFPSTWPCQSFMSPPHRLMGFGNNPLLLFLLLLSGNSNLVLLSYLAMEILCIRIFPLSSYPNPLLLSSPTPTYSYCNLRNPYVYCFCSSLLLTCYGNPLLLFSYLAMAILCICPPTWLWQSSASVLLPGYGNPLLLSSYLAMAILCFSPPTWVWQSSASLLLPGYANPLHLFSYLAMAILCFCPPTWL